MIAMGEWGLPLLHKSETATQSLFFEEGVTGGFMLPLKRSLAPEIQTSATLMASHFRLRMRRIQTGAMKMMYMDAHSQIRMIPPCR